MLNLFKMAKKKKRIVQPIDEVEIISRREHKFRKINLKNKEIIIYNKELNEFQLLPPQSSSYDESSEPKNE
tara:strand:+ start:95 stop:307 length:213 start_codon:yes stop_codon:yes gene_type:complete